MRYVQHKKKIYKLLVRGYKDKAIDLLEKEIASNIDSGLNTLILAEHFSSEENYDDAIAVLEQILPKFNLFPENIRLNICIDLGNLLFKQQKYKKAHYYLHKAYQQKKTPHLLSRLGQIYLELDKIKDAGRVFTYLTKQEPSNADYKALLGYYYIKAEQDQLAEKTLLEVLDRDEWHEAANFYFGYYFFTKKIYDSAIESFTRIKKSHYLKYKGFYYTALIWQIKNDRSKAIEYFTSCLKGVICEDQTTLDMRYNLATLYEQALDFQSALDQLRIIYSYDPAYRDISQKLISDNYKKLRNTFLMDYNSLSNADFVKYTSKLVALLNLNNKQHSFLDDNNILMYQCELKHDGKLNALFNGSIKFIHKENILVFFFRLMHIRGNMLSHILHKVKFPFNSGILVSSGLVSPMTVHDAHNNHISVVMPSQLNRIIQKYPVR